MLADPQFDYVNNDNSDQFTLAGGSNLNVRSLVTGSK